MKRLGVPLWFLVLFASTSPAQETPSTGGVPLQVSKPVFVSLLVPDAVRATEWYRDTFGLTLAKQSTDPGGSYSISILHSEDVIVELIEHELSFAIEDRLPDLKRGERALGIFKVGFEVQGLDVLRDALEARGANLRGDTVLDVELGRRTFVLADPFGNRLQFFERVD